MSLKFITNRNAKTVSASPHRVFNSLKSFIESNEGLELPEAGYLWLMYQVAILIGAAIRPLDGENTERFTVDVATRDGSVITVLGKAPAENFVTKLKGVIDADMALILEANIQPMANLVYQLATCIQIKGLKRSNLKGYHAGSGSLMVFDGEYDAIIYIASVTPAMAASDEFAEDRALKKFLMYHGTASSSPSLLLEAHSAMPRSFQALIPDSDIEAAKRAKEEFYSLIAADAIGKRSLGLAYLWFEGVGQDRGGEKWYQGNAAAEALPVHISLKFQQAVKLYVKVMKAAPEGDDDGTKMEALLASLH